MKSLIIGSQGLVGSALRKRLSNCIEGVQREPDRENKNQVYIDITKYETLFKVFSNHRPNVVYLPAAITNVDKCEDDSTNIVNIRGALTVLRLCEQFESKLVYFSSSYVFNGKGKHPYTVTDEPDPLNNYGKQKRTVENMILQSEAKFLIIRTIGVFGTERRKKNFAKSVISAIFSGRPAIVPNDQYMNPINSGDLAEITIKLASKQTGIFNVAGDTCLSKYDFAMRIAKYFDLTNMIVSVSSEEMKQKAQRPKMGCLDCSNLKDPSVNIPIPSLNSGLTQFLASEFNG